MSPREAAQVDPQQRLLAEVVWEALEDARIPPSSLAGGEVGVYIGVSALDHANLFGGDAGAIESHFMTGNTLSIVANRISYLYDLRGPSFVVDTACSSSLVAVDRAVADLMSGRIETAIVGGVNMLLSPASFIGFSRASMLSPSGACRPFSADCDGYVRSEGAAVFILRRGDAVAGSSVRAVIAATAVNSDGRTSGIALPGLEGQASLLERAYRQAELVPDDVAFVEAHGTGTAVGDPIEAAALGRVIGMGRSMPLPIGSVKSNIGHLEPASGVAGMMKAMLALETRRLPATLHLDQLNPHIDFDVLNLRPASEAIDLGQDGRPLHCGVSSFGFGGTNAHVILSSAPQRSLAPVATDSMVPDALVISASCREALAELASRHAALLNQGVAPARLANAVVTGRQLMRHRAVLPLDTGRNMAAALTKFASGKNAAGVLTGVAPTHAPKICFVYNGNGAQWVGMGRKAYKSNSAFASAFDDADRAFQVAGLGSINEMLFAEDLADRIGSAACAQPLLFGIQIAITAALAAAGMKPDVVLGHSLGEIAAAHAAGILDLEQSVRVLAARARSQEAVRGAGGMATFAADRSAMVRFLSGLGTEEIGIAADNSPNSVTVSGSKEAIAHAMKVARRARIAGRLLDIDYPYHSKLLDGIREHYLAEVGAVKARKPSIAMVSTVTGYIVESKRLDAAYWWQNIRSEVLFQKAVKAAAEAGCDLFIEIGPRPIMTSPISASLEEAGHSARVIHSLSEADEASSGDEGSGVDPIATTLARAIANGFAVAEPPTRQEWVDRSLPLPSYPWQRRTFRYEQSSSAVDIHGTRPRHPLVGARLAQGVPEWRTVLDAELVPYLTDHVVGGEMVVPATALAEMALAVARELSPTGALAIEDFDIVQAMVIPADGQRDVSVRYAEGAGSIEIYSRLRFGADDWTLAARGHIGVAPAMAGSAPEAGEGVSTADAEVIYQKAHETGIDYGDTFQLLRSLRRGDDDVIDVELAQPMENAGVYSRLQILHPASLDAAFHGLFDLLEIDHSRRQAWVPIRFERLTVWRDHAPVTSATIVVDRNSDHLKTVTLWLRGGDGTVVARLDRALLRPVVLAQTMPNDGLYHLAHAPAGLGCAEVNIYDVLAQRYATGSLSGRSEERLLLRAHMRASAHRALSALANAKGELDMARLVLEGRLAQESLDRVRLLLDELAIAGLVRFDGDMPVLAEESGLPDPEVILATFAQDFPLAATDLLLSAHAAAELDAGLRDGGCHSPRPAVLDRHDGIGLLIAPACTELLCAVRAAVAAAAPHKLHVVVLADNAVQVIGGLTEDLLQGQLHLVIAADSAAAIERITRRMPEGTGIDFLDLSAPDLPSIADIVVAILPEGADIALTARLGALLDEDGALLAIESLPDALSAFQNGNVSASNGASSDTAAANWKAAGLVDERTLRSDNGGFVLHIARRAPAATVGGPYLIEEVHADAALVDAVAASISLPPAPKSDSDRPKSVETPINILCIVGGNDSGDAGDLTGMLMGLRRALLDYRSRASRGRFWAVCAAPSAPLQASLGAFVRVAMNELADGDIRLIEIEPGTPPRDAVRALSAIVAAPGAERAYQIHADGRSVLRFVKGLPGATSGGTHDASSIALHFPRPGMLENFQWLDTGKALPGPRDIEVQIIASGLNFRDVMLAMGLLNDDVVDEGAAGAVYGFECAGRVTAKGDAVTQHEIGDLVIGFGKNTFATHIIAPQESFVALPEGIPAEAGAGIPVAFFTSWYSLIELARLAPGEKVLIQGGAGGVGLAAIQIARAVGAEVVATVSTPDKRALAELYGAQHICDSRSLDFAEYVRDRLGGVDVVLNSLSGEAMRASVRCLKPRGRFIELGKRDYVANTSIGVRPFRRNLSYFGVDVDQILALDPEMTVRGLRAVMAGFEDGRYIPLPCMPYDAVEIGSAFRLMQSAGHVGKVVVRPPSTGRLLPAPVETFVPGEGVHLVVGGTRGFGLATALWLAGKGAAKVVVASRSGTINPKHSAQIDAMRASGCTFVVESVDVTDLADVEALVDRVARSHGNIVGVYHTAVTLQDGMLEDLSTETLATVLAPKVTGAAILDRATRTQPVQQFVLFSSASAVIGNPGQSAYAAANGYLEGLARQRRKEGLPALAVAWGAIADVGLLADRAETMKSLSRISGVAGMQSADALNRLDRILGAGSQLSDPVVTCAEFAAEGALVALPLLSSPGFAQIFTGRGSAGVEIGMSLAELVDGKSDAEAQRILTGIVAEEVAQILRLAIQEVDLNASIDSLGMDSLMALELRMSIETKYKLELPVMSITAVSNLRELAQRILQTLRREGGHEAEESGLSNEESQLIALHTDMPLHPITPAWRSEPRASLAGRQ